jgi:uncharacterized protein
MNFISGSVVLVAVLLFAYTITVFVIANRLTRPKRRTVSDLTGQAERIRLESRSDRLGLVASFVPARSDLHEKSVVMLVHGRNACRGWEFRNSSAPLVAHLTANGFAVLLLDLRGHGESDAARLTFGLRERLDVLGAVDCLQARGFERIGVIGASVGAVAALLASVETPAIRALVLDSAFADFAPVVRSQFRQLSGLPNIFLTGALLVARHLTGERLGTFRPLEVMPRVTAKMLVIHAQGDTMVSPDQAVDLAKTGQAAHWITAGDSHLAAYRSQPDEYAARVVAFLNTNLAVQDGPVSEMQFRPTDPRPTDPRTSDPRTGIAQGATHDTV